MKGQIFGNFLMKDQKDKWCRIIFYSQF